MSAIGGRNSSGTTFCLSRVNFIVLQEMSLLSSATAMCLHVCGEREGGQECKGASHQETDTGPAEIVSYFLNILPFHNKIYVSKSHISCLQSWK